MKTLPTFKEQFDKITEAYIKGEIKPMDKRFCFCGTLANDYEWGSKKRVGYYPYKISEYKKMESALLLEIPMFGRIFVGRKKYEEKLFQGMCAALEVLKDIHCEHGENIEEQFEFKKRELVPA